MLNGPAFFCPSNAVILALHVPQKVAPISTGMCPVNASPRRGLARQQLPTALWPHREDRRPPLQSGRCREIGDAKENGVSVPFAASIPQDEMPPDDPFRRPHHLRFTGWSPDSFDLVVFLNWFRVASRETRVPKTLGTQHSCARHAILAANGAFSPARSDCRPLRATQSQNPHAHARRINRRNIGRISTRNRSSISSVIALIGRRTRTDKPASTTWR